MSVHQTKDGRWFVKVEKGKIPDDQNRTRIYFGRGIEAEIKANEKNRELGLGIPRAVTDTSPTFARLAEDYMAAKGAAMAEPSRISLSAKVVNVILPRIGHLKAMQVTPHVLDLYVIDRLKSVKKTTVHRDLSDIRAILRWAVKRRYISYNPIDGFTFPTRDDEIITPPSKTEIQAILKNSPAHLKRAIIISYYTGLRPGAVELLQLTWQDIDLVDESITIRSANKGGLRMRDVPIMELGFIRTLGTWLQEDSLQKKKPELPVVTFKGKKIGSLKTAWKTAKREAKITRRLRLYDLRHSFATKMLDNDADLKHVSMLLGHRSVQQTVDTYQHKSKKLTEEALTKLPSILE